MVAEKPLAKDGKGAVALEEDGGAPFYEYVFLLAGVNCGPAKSRQFR